MAMRYLQVTHIPFRRTAEGKIATDALWANDLRAVSASIGPIVVAAPEQQEHETWGPTEAVFEPEGPISFIGFPPMRGKRDLWRLIEIRKILRREVKRADLVHTSNLFPPYLGLLYAHRLAVREGKKTVFAVAEDYADMLGWEWVRLARGRMERWRRRRTLQKMDRLVKKAASQASLTFLFTPAAVAQFRLIVPEGVAVRDTTHREEDVISEKELKEKCRRLLKKRPLKLLSACRHKPLKGGDYLIRAVSLLKERGVEVEAALYGRGPMTEEWKRLAKALHVSDRISFPGAVVPEEIYSKTAQADLFIMPHRTSDFARAFYDAMVGAAPVVAFETIASSGTVRNRIDGVLAPLDNAVALALAIEGLHRDREQIVKMASAARERALAETQKIWHGYRAGRIRELFR